MDQRVACIHQKIIKGSLPLKKRRLDLQDHHTPTLQHPASHLLPSGSFDIKKSPLTSPQSSASESQASQAMFLPEQYRALHTYPNADSANPEKIASLIAAAASSAFSSTKDGSNMTALGRADDNTLSGNTASTLHTKRRVSRIDIQQTPSTHRQTTTTEPKYKDHCKENFLQFADAKEPREGAANSNEALSAKTTCARYFPAVKRGHNDSKLCDRVPDHSEIAKRPKKSSLNFVDDHNESVSSFTSAFNTMVSHVPTGSVITPNTVPAPLHQNKRFTGAKDEIRCSAITTRGRSCAYVATQNSKYCNLHAGYDVNPPPRRGGCKALIAKQEKETSLGMFSPLPASSVVKTSKQIRSKTMPMVSPCPPPCPELSVVSPPSISSEDSGRLSPSLTSGRSLTQKSVKMFERKNDRRMTSKLAEIHAGSPCLLLSMLSTEKWANTTVKISTGPMINRLGKVEKWGNGWVNVRIPGIGLHNRRSFELYVCDDRGDTFDDEDEVVEATAESSRRSQQHCSGNASADDSIARCVSSDTAVSPSPTTQLSDCMSMFAKSQIPKLTIRLNTSSSSFHNKEENPPRNFQPVPFTPILDTPLIEKPLMDHTESYDTAKIGFDDQTQICALEPRGLPNSASIAEVTPSSPPKKTHTDLTLVETVLLHDEGNLPKHKYDMLFGTAALDRSRRTISKPTRYEDTQMIAVPTSTKQKRVRKQVATETVLAAKEDAGCAGGVSVVANTCDLFSK